MRRTKDKLHELESQATSYLIDSEQSEVPDCTHVTIGMCRGVVSKMSMYWNDLMYHTKLARYTKHVLLSLMSTVLSEHRLAFLRHVNMGYSGSWFYCYVT